MCKQITVTLPGPTRHQINLSVVLHHHVESCSITQCLSQLVSGYQSLLQLFFSSCRRKERNKDKELLQPLRYINRIRNGKLVFLRWPVACAHVQSLVADSHRSLFAVCNWRCPWCNGYRRRKWTRRHEFKSWTRLIAFSHSTNTLGKGMNPIILPPAMGK